MNLKTMLARFESALGYQNLAEEMVLLPEPKVQSAKKSTATKQAKSINFIVGYNSSPKSQTALDITLWIAHQTRLVTTQEVTVQVVYAIRRSAEKLRRRYLQIRCGKCLGCQVESVGFRGNIRP